MPKSKDEILTNLREYVGDKTDDKSIALIEDVTDILNGRDDVNVITEDERSEYERRISELETERDELDTAWRTKYRDRFFSAEEKADDIVEAEEEIETEKIEIKDLFKE